MNLAIIPARGNSKRIKNKNIVQFLGKPIIYWSIKAAIRSKIFDKIIVSSDNTKILKLALKFGAAVPFYRPGHLANEKTEVMQVIKHSINWFKNKKIKLKNVCCIFATAPLLNYKRIIEGYNVLKRSKCDFVFSATRNKNSLIRSFYFKKKKLKMINNYFYHFRSQDLPTTFSDAGQFYWAEHKTWMREKMIFTKNSKIIEIPNFEACDINTIEDLNEARRLSQKNR